MSNLIPIVSSSPPPMDDSGGFDGGWDDDDDFGTFTGANDSVLSTPGKPSDWSTPAGDQENDKFTFTNWAEPGSDNFQRNSCSAADSGIGGFANFSAMGESTNLAETNHSHSDNEEKSSINKLDADTNGHIPIAREVEDTSSKQSLTDSGLYSSDVSPLRQTEVTEGDSKSLSDSDSVGDHHLDKISSEMKDEKDSVDIDHISDDDPDDSIQNEQISEKTKDSESESKSNSNEAHDGIEEKSVSHNSKDILPSESIPQAKSSSHSNDDDEINSLSVSQSNLQADAHLSATNTECAISDTEYQTDNLVIESQSLENECAKSGTNVKEQEHDLSTDCDSEPVPNSDSRTDSENHEDSVSQSEDSLPGNTEDEEQKDSETKNIELGSVAEKSDNLGSCNITEDNSEGSQKDSDLNVPPEQMNVSPDSGAGSDVDLKDSEIENSDSAHTVKDTDATHESSECDAQNITKDENDEENVVDDFTGFNQANSGNESDFDDFSAFDSGTSDNKSKEEFGKFATVESEKTNDGVNQEIDTNDAFKDEKSNSDYGDFDDFTAFTSENDNKDTDFGKFSENQSQSQTATKVSSSDFGNFTESGSSFAAFGSESVADNVENSETTDDWAAFSEPQITEPVAASEIDDEEWAAFGGEQEPVSKNDDETPASVHPAQPSIQNLSKEEKVMFAVTGCFSSVIGVADAEVTQEHEDVLEIDTKSREVDLWGNMRGLKTTNALGYHWSQSQWNNHLYSTLHVDTRNILFGHKKSSSMPIFASNLTMLEPTKGPLGSNSRSQETLIDTSKSEDSQVYTQDTIPPAQFDWSSSGLTNPLEAANKTLNLDFLIQEAENSSGKSHALESEFLTPDDVSHKPAAIQPLENILANLKSSSTFKPTNQNEDLSQEASRIIQSLPNLSFMKTKVLMFPLKLND